MLGRALHQIRDALLSITYPQNCHICARPVESYRDGVCCAACWEDRTLTRLLNSLPNCFKCGAPMAALRGTRSLAEPERLLCGGCSDAPFAAARACGEYAGALEASILFLKTHPHICPRLRRIVRETVLLHSHVLNADVVIPVPLHRSRERDRGFNQAAVIGASIAADFRLTLDVRSLLRIKHTERHRAGMDAVDRRRSVEGAFQVVRPRLIEGAGVLLIDDVYTTGSTASSSARALCQAGANRVTVLTIARVTGASGSKLDGRPVRASG